MSGFTFGGTSTNTGSGFSFGGNKPATTTGGSTGFSFGNTGGTTQPSTTTGTSGFNFGSSSTQPTTNTGNTTGFNFGTSNTNKPATTTGFNFGTSQPTTTGTTTGTTGFNFGTTGTTTGQQQQTSGFNFGQPTTNTGTTTSGFNFGQTGQPQQQQQTMGGGFMLPGGGGGMFPSQLQQQAPTVEQQLNIIKQKYDDTSLYCRFNYFFYNVVEENKLQPTLNGLMMKYSQLIPMDQWKQAMIQNPDPTKLVPVPARGFRDVTQRVEQQQKRVEVLNQFVKHLDSKVNECKRKHEVDALTKIEQIKQRHMDLSTRILKIQRKLEVLMQQGVGIRNEDISLRNKLNTLQRELHKPNQYRGRLNELVPQVNYYLQQSNLLMNTDKNLIDEERKESVKVFLEQQTDGLMNLLSILKKDLKDVNYMKQQITTEKQKYRSLK
ncbi:hypothetical protein ABK040_014021 [Willaertia magna]